MSESEFDSVFKVLAKLQDDCDNDVVWSINFRINTVEVRASRYAGGGHSVSRSISESKQMCERSLLSLYERIHSVDTFKMFFQKQQPFQGEFQMSQVSFPGYEYKKGVSTYLGEFE